MFDKKGRWWPQRLADKKVRKRWKRLRLGSSPPCFKACPDCTAHRMARVKFGSGREMRNLGR